MALLITTDIRSPERQKQGHSAAEVVSQAY
jgi:hypothetical protein